MMNGVCVVVFMTPTSASAADSAAVEVSLITRRDSSLANYVIEAVLKAA